MKKVLQRRPSASMVVALTALVVASSGTAIAASLVSGNKLIKKNSLSGNRLVKHSVTSTQVNVNKLGKVPSAKNADHATSATSASVATVATSANTAGNALNSVNAQIAGSLTGLTRFNKSIAPAGTAPATAGTTTLASAGPMTVTGVCYTAGGENIGAIYLSSTAAGYYNTNNAGSTALPANTAEDVDLNDASGSPGTPDFEDPYNPFAAITGTLSNYLDGEVSVGVNLTSANQCTFAGFVSAS